MLVFVLHLTIPIVCSVFFSTIFLLILWYLLTSFYFLVVKVYNKPDKVNLWMNRHFCIIEIIYPLASCTFVIGLQMFWKNCLFWPEIFSCSPIKHKSPAFYLKIVKITMYGHIQTVKLGHIFSWSVKNNISMPYISCTVVWR